MISGASEEELDIAIARTDLLLQIEALEQRIERAIEYIKSIAIIPNVNEEDNLIGILKGYII